MSSENTAAAQQPATIPVTITSQYVKDFSFENPNAPQIFAPTQATPEIAMNVNINTRTVSPNMYEVLLALKIESRLEGKTAFISELVYGGIFSLPQLPEDQMRMFLLVEAPRLLFPFARNVLMAAIREGGYPHVMVNPIDFYSLYVANQDKVGSMLAAGVA